MDNGGEFVLIGPNAWPLLGLVVIMAVIGWWFSRSGREARPSMWRAFWWSFTCKYFPGVASWIMSYRAYEQSVMEDDENTDDDPATTTIAKEQQSIAITQQDRNVLLFQGETQALAKMVHAGKVGETEGIKIVYGVSPSSSNPKYIAARAALKEELEKLDPPKFRELDQKSRPILTPIRRPRPR